MKASLTVKPTEMNAIQPLALATALPVTFPVASLVQVQQPPAPATTVIVKVISGDNRMDPLIDDATYRFNDGSPVGTAVTVTYSFPTDRPSTYTGDNALGWRPFSAAQQDATRTMLTLLQQMTKMTFQEVTESASLSGTMRFSNNTQATSAGYALLPNSTKTDLDADTWIASGASAPVVLGDYAWYTLAHEIGHAVGLNHPGNYNAGEAVNQDTVGNYLSVNEDTFFNTIMSYRQSAQFINPFWFQPYDMLTLRYLYGKTNYEAGNNTYRYTDTDGRFVANIIDDGGVDTLDFSAVTVGLVLNLTPGAYSSVGKIAAGANALANLTTSFDAIIENVIGTALGDAMLGNAASNSFTGGGGDDLIDGAAGVDMAIYSGPRAAYTVTLGGGDAIVRGGGEGSDTLTNVERLQFADTKLALDLAGSAGRVAKLLGAVFGPPSVSNKLYVGIGLSLLDSGTTYEQLAALAVGATGTTTNPGVVNLLWTNLFGSAPTAEQAAPYVALLAGGSLTVGALTVLAADLDLNATRIDLMGLTTTGLEYGP